MIADTSALVPLLIDHPMTDSAQRLLPGKPLVSPAIMLVEAANALWSYSLRGAITAGQITALLTELQNAVLIVPDHTVLARAVLLATQNRHPVYDCLFLALALDRDEPLATADRRLASLARHLSIQTELIEPSS